MDTLKASKVASDNSIISDLLKSDEIHAYEIYVSHLQHAEENGDESTELLNLIPIFDHPTLLPTICLYTALERCNRHWPKMEVISAYTRLRQNLPKTAGSSSNSDSDIFTQKLDKLVNSYFIGPMSFTTSDAPALIDPSTERTLTHSELYSFVKNFKLPLLVGSSSSRKPVIILALPNGYLLALACLAISSYYTAAPVSISGGPKQLQSDIEIIKPKAILVRSQDVKKLGLNEKWVKLNGIILLYLEQDSTLKFSVKSLERIEGKEFEDCRPNEAGDIALILLTSGTSGTKKAVPIKTMSLLTGTSCVITSWGLSSQDICINMMPLHHV